MLYAIRTFLPILLLFTTLSITANAEDLDYVAEHILESVMNARYSALPAPEFDGTKNSQRIQAGYFNFTGGSLDTHGVLLAYQTERPIQNSKAALIYGFFFDIQNIGKSKDTTIAKLTDLSTNPKHLVDANIRSARGQGTHSGVSISYLKPINEKLLWQVGASLNYFKASNYKVELTTTSESPNFDATMDYSQSYNNISPFATLNWFHDPIKNRYVVSGRLIAIFPLPRKDFKRDEEHSSFNVYVDGNDKHIPDPYAGFSYSIEDIKTHWKADIGTTIWTYFIEGQMHKGIENPIVFTFSYLI